MKQRVFLGLGGNQGDVEASIKQAVLLLSEMPGTDGVLLSPMYKNAPMGSSGQADYINAVCQLDTALSPQQLLEHTQRIENSLGRVRQSDRWGPRTMDIDILLYGQQQINDSRLTIPHYGMAERPFVLLPLSDLLGDLDIPGKGSLKQLLLKVDLSDMRKISS